MTKHLKYLAKPKAAIKLHEMDPVFKQRIQEREEKAEKEAKKPPGTALLKKMATSDEYEEQREVLKGIQKAKSGTKTEKPAQMHRAKNLSYNRKVGTTVEKHLKSEHEKTLFALKLKRYQ